MAWPTPKVSIAFNDGPYVASPVWTDITSYVYSADVSRGRSDDYSQFIGTAQVVLNNNSRLFDPFYTAGTYYGKLLPRRQIKIEGVSGVTTYAVFRGFVDGFPAAWDQAGKFATTTLSCFDGLSLLSQELLNDYVYDYTKTLNPTNYWRANDGQASTTITDVVGKLSMTPGSTSANYRVGQSATSALATNMVTIQDAYRGTDTSFTSTSQSFSVSGWLIPLDTNGQITFTGSSQAGFNVNSIVQISTNQVLASLQTSAITQSYALSTASIYDKNGAPIFFTATFTPATKLVRLYINGKLQTGSTFTAATGTFLLPLIQITVTGAGIQEIAIYNSVLSDAQALALYNVNNNNVSETSAARMTRLLGYTSWDASLQSVTASPVATVGALSPPNSNLVAEMQLVNNSEDGDLFVTRAGVIKFTDRNYVYTNTSSNTSQATFASGSIPFQPSVQINYDAAAIRNDITVTFTGGGQTSTTNATSVTAYGTNAMNTSTQLSTQAQAVTLAAYQATVNGQLLTNISPVSVGVTAATSDWSTLLGLELLDRYTLTVQPPTGNSISQAELINRIEHRIVPGQWQMTVDGSARYASWFILDKSLLDGTDLLQ